MQSPGTTPASFITILNSAPQASAATAKAEWVELLQDVIEVLHEMDGRLVDAPVDADEQKGFDERLAYNETRASDVLGKSQDAEILAGNKHVLALIATTRGDAELALSLFAESYRLRSATSTLHNFAMACAKFGRFSDSQAAMLRVFKECPDDVDRLRAVYHTSMTVGDFFLTIEVADRLRALKRSEQIPSLIHPRLQRWLDEMLAENPSRVALYRERWAVAVDAAQRVGLHLVGSGMSYGLNSVSIRFQCSDADPALLARADWAIADAICEQFDDPMTDHFTFSTMSSYGR